MNVNPIVESALSTIGLPVKPDNYTGNSIDYIIYNYADERPVLYADDVDQYDETTIQVHYFTKSNNPHTIKKSIRRLLRAANFSIVDTQQNYETDTGYTHVVVTACIEGFINDDN